MTFHSITAKQVQQPQVIFYLPAKNLKQEEYCRTTQSCCCLFFFFFPLLSSLERIHLAYVKQGKVIIMDALKSGNHKGLCIYFLIFRQFLTIQLGKKKSTQRQLLALFTTLHCYVLSFFPNAKDTVSRTWMHIKIICIKQC